MCPECGDALSLERLRHQVEHREWRERRMPRDPITTAGLIGSILGIGWPLAVLMLGVLARDQRALDAGRLLALSAVCAVQVGMVTMYLGSMSSMKGWPRRRKMGMAVLAWCWGPVVLLAMFLLR